MGIEIEAKMAVEYLEGVREALRTRGGVFKGKTFEINEFFDMADEALRAAGKGLRVRTNRDVGTGKERFVVTFKGPRREDSAVKAREEIEVEVSERAAFVEMLTALGFSSTLSFEKRRESWTLMDCKVELDEVPILGSFAEVEGTSEEAVLRVTGTLGLGERPVILGSYVGMLADYLRERGEKLRHIAFSKGAS